MFYWIASSTRILLIHLLCLPIFSELMKTSFLCCVMCCLLVFCFLWIATICSWSYSCCILFPQFFFEKYMWILLQFAVSVFKQFLVYSLLVFIIFIFICMSLVVSFHIWFYWWSFCYSSFFLSFQFSLSYLYRVYYALQYLYNSVLLILFSIHHLLVFLIIFLYCCLTFWYVVCLLL